LTNHNFFISDEIRKENNDFNQIWISKNKFLDYSVIKVNDLDVSPKQKIDSVQFEVVWFKNIDRLMELLPSEFEYEKYCLVDVGCGSGISTFYFASKYRFKNFYGFDFSSSLIESALKNKSKFFGNNQNKLDMKFEVNNAREFKLIESSILFMFNPFGIETMEKMILNNLNHMKRTRSIILYANDLYLDLLLKYGNLIKRNDLFNLSCIQF